MSDTLKSIIETLEVLDKEGNEDALEVLNFIVNLLNDCSTTRFCKANLDRSFKMKRITVVVSYRGNN